MARHTDGATAVRILAPHRACDARVGHNISAHISAVVVEKVGGTDEVRAAQQLSCLRNDAEKPARTSHITPASSVWQDLAVIMDGRALGGTFFSIHVLYAIESTGNHVARRDLLAIGQLRTFDHARLHYQVVGQHEHFMQRRFVVNGILQSGAKQGSGLENASPGIDARARSQIMHPHHVVIHRRTL